MEGVAVENQNEILKKVVCELVEGFYRKSGRGVLLSTLGQLLHRGGIDFKSMLGKKKLGEFIVDELSDVLNVEGVQDSQNIKLITPKGEVRFGGGGEIFYSAPESAPPVSLKYKRAIWSAFSKGVDEGKKRVLRIKPHPLYMDIFAAEEVPDGFLLIGDDVIKENLAGMDSGLIEGSIMTWSELNNISMLDILYKAQEKANPVKDERSLLEKILLAIPETDHKRIQLPLDVILKLLKSE